MKNEKKSIKFVKFLPTIVTLAAFCLGLTAMRFAIDGKFHIATGMLIMAGVLDMLDGRLARVLGQSSALGAELDSFSDLTCFGVAPAIIAYLVSLHKLGRLGWGISVFYALCCVIRLAKFNVMSDSDDEGDSHFFVGVPSPGGAGFALLPCLLFFATGVEWLLNPKMFVLSVIFAGLCMIGKFRVISAKSINFNGGGLSIVLLIIFVLVCTVIDFWVTCSGITIIYMILVPVSAFLYNKNRHNRDE